MSTKTAADFKVKHDPATIIARLEKELEDAKGQIGLQSAIKEVLGLHGLSERKVSPAWVASRKKSSDSSLGTPVILISDLHWGENVDPKHIGGVNSFNLDIARKRLRHTIDTAIKLCQMIDTNMRYPGIVVPLLGDNVSGSIHEELEATNELPTIPTVLDVAEHLEGAIGLLADTFGHVYIPCVTGNHGRNTLKMWSKNRQHTSFDWLLYKILEKSFQGDKRVHVHVSDSPDLRFDVQGRTYLATHGDRLGHGGDGLIGFIGPVSRGDHKRRTRQQQINQPYDTLICGHWHQYLHSGRLIVNGSLKGYDEYAYTESFPFEHPQQALWIVHPTHGETFRMPVRCNAS